jgi:preprotein translocase subunit Sss1
MNTQQNIEERLWDYIDGISSADEKSLIETLLKNDLDWKTTYQELLETQRLMRTSELESPSLRFSKNVMDEIMKLHIAPATKNYINKKIIWGIGFFFIALIVGFLIYGFGQIDWNVKGDTKLPVDLSKVDYSRVFNNTYVNIFMMINVVLGLFLLDNYLSNKRKEFRKG